MTAVAPLFDDINDNKENAKPINGEEVMKDVPQANGGQVHIISNILEGTKRLTNTLYDQTGLSHIPVVQNNVKTLQVLSDQYLNKCADMIDSRLDTVLRKSKNLVRMTKKGLKRLSADEKLLVQLVKTWCTTHLTDYRNGFVLSLQDFLKKLREDSKLQVHLENIKEKVSSFYSVASSVWGKFMKGDAVARRRVILEIIANSLCTFDNISGEEAFVEAMLNMGELILEQNRSIREKVGTLSFESFLVKVKTEAGDKLNEAKDKEGMYDELAAKYYSVLIQLKKLIDAQDRFQSSYVMRLVQYGGALAFNAIEKFVTSAYEQIPHLPDGENEDVNGHLEKENSTSDENNAETDVKTKKKGKKISTSALIMKKSKESYIERTKVMVHKMNAIRIYLQGQVPMVRTIIQKEFNAIIRFGQNLITFLWAATATFIDRFYLPISTYVTTTIQPGKRLVDVGIYLNVQKDSVVALLEANEQYRAMKRFVVLKFEENRLRLKFRMEQLKDLREVLERFVQEVITLARSQDVPVKQLPSKVYNLALTMYKQQLPKGKKEKKPLL